jgi:pimeloyl-ACP methyl ester carboxylesterase
MIHGAEDVGWSWHLVETESRARGHDVVAPDLPGDDDSAELNEYADSVVEAVGDRKDLIAYHCGELSQTLGIHGCRRSTSGAPIGHR